MLQSADMHGLSKYKLDSAATILHKCELNRRALSSLWVEGEVSANKQLSKIICLIICHIVHIVEHTWVEPC
jgi:hypothetical protein